METRQVSCNQCGRDFHVGGDLYVTINGHFHAYCTHCGAFLDCEYVVAQQQWDGFLVPNPMGPDTTPSPMRQSLPDNPTDNRSHNADNDSELSPRSVLLDSAASGMLQSDRERATSAVDSAYDRGYTLGFHTGYARGIEHALSLLNAHNSRLKQQASRSIQAHRDLTRNGVD